MEGVYHYVEIVRQFIRVIMIRGPFCLEYLLGKEYLWSTHPIEMVMIKMVKRLMEILRVVIRVV